MFKPLPRFIRFLFCVDIFLVIAFLLNYFAGDPFWKLSQMFHLEQENNIPTWYSSIQLFILAVFLGLFVCRNIDYSRIRWWLLAGLSLIFLLLSIDEIAQFHEYIGYKLDYFLPGGTRSGTMISYTGLWGVVVAGPFLLYLLAMMYAVREYFRGVRSAMSNFLIGATFLVMGAGGMDMVANFVERKSGFHIVEIVIEEFLEMAGVTFMLWAVYSLLLTYNLHIALDRAVLNAPNLPRCDSNTSPGE